MTPGTRHWIEAIIKDGFIEGRLICEHPDLAGKCDIVPWWEHEGQEILADNGEEHIFGRVEVSPSWDGDEFYLDPGGQR